MVLARIDGAQGASTVPCWSADGPAPDGVVVAAEGTTPGDAARTVGAVAREVDGPVVVQTSSAEVLAACLDAGAVAGHDPAGAGGPAYLAAARSAGAAVVVGAPMTAPARSIDRAPQLVALADRLAIEGFPPGRTGVDPSRSGSGIGAGEVACLDEVGAVAARGTPVLVEVRAGNGPADDVRAGAACAVLVARGARLVVTTDVRTTRRVVAIMEELLRAHAATRADAEALG